MTNIAEQVMLLSVPCSSEQPAEKQETSSDLLALHLHLCRFTMTVPMTYGCLLQFQCAQAVQRVPKIQELSRSVRPAAIHHPWRPALTIYACGIIRADAVLLLDKCTISSPPDGATGTRWQVTGLDIA